MAAQGISETLYKHCQGNADLDHYNNGTNLVTITRYLNSHGCHWTHDINETEDTTARVGHDRRKRSAGPVEEGTNPTISRLREIAHILHIASVVILAVMVLEVN